MPEPALLTVLTPVIVGFAAVALALSLGHVGLQLRILRLGPKPATDWRPFASIVLPCRGHQQGLEANARAFASQEYGPHEVLFVVDDRSDPSVPILENVARDHPRVQILVSEPDAVGRDWPVGKMIAQRTGALRSDPRSEVLVFADADGRPQSGWLASLVAPLRDERVGVVTGYRWYHAAGQPTLATLARDSFDHMVAGGFTARNVHMVWGGAMALRKADFERPEIAEEWRRCISDDLGITNAIVRMKRKIVFAPGAMVAAPEDQTGAQVMEFLTRQVAINRASHRWMYRVTAAIFAWSSIGLLAGLAFVALWPSQTLGWAGVALVATAACQTFRATLMARLAHRVLGSLRNRPLSERVAQIALIPLMPLFTLVIFAKARRLKTITWRGRKYTLARVAAGDVTPDS